MKWLFGAVALATLPCGDLLAQRPASARTRATFVTTVEGVSEYRLPNGLRILLLPDSSRPTVTINVAYLVGSRNEGAGEAGMAHMLEHMLFRGTKGHPNMLAEQTSRGSRRAGGTSADQTYYYETINASDSLIDWALDLQADRMMNALISRESLASEFSVVRNELELAESDPATAARARLFSAAFRFHPYGRGVLGTQSDIENMPAERLRAFYTRYYQPDNAILVVSGRMHPARMLAAIEGKFGAMPRPARSAALGNLLEPVYTVEPPQDGERYITLRRATDEQILLLGYHIPGVPHPDNATLEVLADVLGSNPSGRLYKALVDTREAVFVNGDVFSSADPNLMYLRAKLRRDQSLDSAYARMLRMIDSSTTSGFSAEEVTRARTSLLRNMQLLMGNSELFGILLADWAGAGDWRLAFLHRDRLAKVTPEDVRRVAALYLKPSNRTTVAVIPTDNPDRTTVPAAPSVESMVAGYKGGTAVEAGENLDPSPRSLEARITRTTLPSGMRVTLLPKRTRAERVSAQLVVRYGTEESLFGKAQVASLTGGMLMRGTERLTRQQLIDSLSRLTAAVTARASNNTATIEIQTTRQSLPHVIDLVAGMIKAPRLDAEELERYKKERLGALDVQKTEPIQRALSAATGQLTPRTVGHVLRAMTPEEQMEAITATSIDDVRRFHRANYGGSAADFAAVGDFDAAVVSQKLAQHFGGWRNPSPYAPLLRRYVPTDSDFVKLEIPDKANAAFAAAIAIPLREDDPDYPAMLMANHMLAGARTSVLMTRLREREGLTYSVTGFFVTQPLDRYIAWSMVAIAAPRNIERLQRSFREEMDRVVTKGFSADELQTYRNGLLELRAQARSLDEQLVPLLITRSSAGRTLAFEDALDAAIGRLTLDQVNAAVRKYIDPSRLALGRAGDFLNNPPVR